MKVAVLSPVWFPVPPTGYGGIEWVVWLLADGLVDAGHDVTLFASGDSETSARLVPCCEKALRLNKNAVTDRLAHHFVMLEEVLERADQFDIIHFHIDYLHFPASRREPRLLSMNTA